MRFALALTLAVGLAFPPGSLSEAAPRHMALPAAQQSSSLQTVSSRVSFSARPVAGVRNPRTRRHGQRWKSRRFREVVPFWARERPDEMPYVPPPPRTGFKLVVTEAAPTRLHPYASGWVSRCEARHATFDAQTGTYLGADRKLHRCK